MRYIYEERESEREKEKLQKENNYLPINLIAGNRGGLIAGDHKGSSFTTLRRHVPSTPMFTIDAQLSFRRGARIVAAPACVHVFRRLVSAVSLTC